MIILHLCTKNLDDVIYSSWDIESDRLTLIIYGSFFALLPPPKTPKNHNFEKI